MQLKKYIPRITWKSEAEELEETKANLLGIAEEADQIVKINTALTIALANVQQQASQYKQDAIVILTAIALQHGGELFVKNEFFEMQNTDENTSLSLSLKKEDDGSLHISVEEKTVEEQEIEEEEKENE